MSTVFITLISLFAILVTYFIQRHVKSRRYWKLLEDFYGDKPDLLFGNALQLGSNSEVFTQRTMKIFERAGYGDYKFIIGPHAFVNLCTPDSVETLLSQTKEITKMNEYFYFKDWLGDGLLLSTGNKWRTRRKILTPAFHFKILEMFVKVFNDNGDILVNDLEEKTGELFDIFPYINAYALDVICESTMGVSVDAQSNKTSEYVQAVHSMCILLNNRFRSILKRISWIYKLTEDYRVYEKNKKILHDMTNRVIKARKEALKDQIEKVKNGEPLLEEDDVFIGRKKKIAFLDLLLLSKLPDGKFLNDEDVREEVDTFMFEGHDTITSGIAFTIYEMSRNPRAQQLAYEEIIAVIGDNPSKEITFQNMQDLKYLEMVIKESLRLYPPVPKFGRFLGTDMKLPGGKIVPAGCTIMVDAIALGRNPLVYPDPEKYDPERFSPDNTTRRHPFAYVPFSAGLRNCIGQKYAMLEMKTVLSKILVKYELISGGDDVKVRVSSEVIIKTENGVQIYIKERSSKK